MVSSLGKWYAAVYVAVTENPKEPEENRYSIHMHVIAVDKNIQKIEHLICKQSNQRGLPSKVSVEDITDRPWDYIHSKIFAIDEYDLDRVAIADYSRRHLILSNDDFKLKIPENFP